MKKEKEGNPPSFLPSLLPSFRPKYSAQFTAFIGPLIAAWQRQRERERETERERLRESEREGERGRERERAVKVHGVRWAGREFTDEKTLPHLFVQFEGAPLLWNALVLREEV